MKRVFFPSIVLFSLMMPSCNSDKPVTESTEEVVEQVVVEEPKAPEQVVLKSDGMTLTEVLGSPKYPNSKLTMTSPKQEEVLELGPVNFAWEINGGNYTLGTQSGDATTKGCSNSGKGQHIHVILDNQPYEASYGTEYTTKAELEAGNHVALTFISRSYHESLKHEGAYALTQFKVGEEEMDEIDLSAEHLFYSRPKGSYNITDAANVMLDFYLVNTKIAEGGNYVHVTFNDKVAFNITKWVPYFIEGLPAGTNKVQLQLMDKDGNVIPGPYNVVEREFTILQ